MPPVPVIAPESVKGAVEARSKVAPPASKEIFCERETPLTPGRLSVPPSKLNVPAAFPKLFAAVMLMVPPLKFVPPL